MKKKLQRIFTYCCLLLIFMSVQSANTQPQITKTTSTRYFEFHNNYWVNLHHFLYQKAEGGQEKKLKEDGNRFLDIGEKEIEKHLTRKERKQLEIATQYYKEHIISKNLEQKLSETRAWLQQQDKVIKDTSFTAAYTKVLNAFSQVYRNSFWPIHKKRNEVFLSQQLPVIASIESLVMPKMQGLLQNQLPENSKIRVDLTAYANYAGAYTQSNPDFNTLLSTIDPGSNTSSIVETIFHEASHLLTGFGSPLRDLIFNKSKEMGIAFPNNLWHAILFYLCGRVVQDQLAKLNTNHVLTMDEGNIFSRYNTPALRSCLEKYYAGSIGLTEAIETLLKN